MKGVNCLYDLKVKFADLKIEVQESLGWYVDTRHGRWTMALGEVYLNMHVITDMKQADELAKLKKKRASTKKITPNAVYEDEVQA
jgi:hypothetical protein